MYYYEQPHSEEARITLSSLLLLAIFFSAVAFIVAAAIWQPWDDDAGPAIVPTADTSFDVPVPDQVAPDDAVEVVQPQAP